MRIYLDIETIPSQEPEVQEEIRAAHEDKAQPLRDELARLEAEHQDPTPPANYKDPEKIEAWKEDKRKKLAGEIEKAREKLAGVEDQADQEWRKTAFAGDRGEIVCVAWAVGGNPIEVLSRGLDEAEGDLLAAWFGRLAEQVDDPGGHWRPQWVGHNVQDFDLRFLFQRAVIHGLRPPLPLPHDARPGSDQVFDTMTAWAGFRNRISLDRLCRALGIPTKGAELGGEEIDGAKVWDYVQAGQVEKVAAYCAADVERVREVHRRLTFAAATAPAPATAEAAPAEARA
jgi:hypothetical protein